MQSLLLNVSAILLAIIVIVTTAVFKRYSYWKQRNVFCLTPTFLLGNASEIFTQKKSFADIFRNLYFEAKKVGQKHAGFYFLLSPQYIPIDLNIIKNILQNDFQHFTDRGFYCNERDDPLSGHLFLMEGEKWKNLRAKLTPTFTSGKMKMMLPIVVEKADHLTSFLKRQVPTTVEMKDLMARLTTDIIGSVAFGIECNSIENSDAEFIKYSKMFMDETFLSLTIKMLTFVAPETMKFLHVSTTPKELSKFFMKMVQETVKYREENNIHRKDFMDLLIQLKNRGEVDGENKTDVDANKNVLSMNQLIAQAFLFFLAGYETSSSAMSFCLYELSCREDIQNKLRQEVNDIMENHGNNITYEALAEMKYMDMVLFETLRKYSPFPILNRVCTSSYSIPELNLVIEKGTKIVIPIEAIHYDADIYPNPELFDPDRFTEANKSRRHPFAFLPFGEGPRICIGMRFGLMQAKTGLALLLKNFRFQLNSKTSRPLKLDPKKFNTTARDGIWMDVTNMK